MNKGDLACGDVVRVRSDERSCGSYEAMIIAHSNHNECLIVLIEDLFHDIYTPVSITYESISHVTGHANITNALFKAYKTAP